MSKQDEGEIETGPPGPTTVSLKKTTIDTWNDPARKTQRGLLNIIDEALSDYSNINLSEEQSAQLAKSLKKFALGASGFILMLCKGNKCHFAERCVLVQMKSKSQPHGLAPVNSDCLLEANLLRDSLSSYIQEYSVEPGNYTEVNITSELAEIEVLLWRINMQLSLPENALLVIDQTVGFDRNTHQPIVQQQVSPLFEQKQKLEARKSKLHKLMVGDRQEKYKKEAALKQKPDTDASSQMSDVKKRLQEMQLKLKGPASEQVIDVTPEDLMLQDQEK